MTDLPKRLEAAGRREAGESNVIGAWVNEHFLKGHRSLHPLIQKMAEALEKVGAYNKPIGFDGHNGPCDDKYWYKQELMSRDIAHEVLLELEKYLEGK